MRIAADGTQQRIRPGFDNVEGVAFDPLTGDLYIGEIEKSTLWRVRHSWPADTDPVKAV